MEVPCENTLTVILNDRNFEASKETKDSVGRKCHIWVNSQAEAQDFQKRNDEAAKQQAAGGVK